MKYFKATNKDIDELIMLRLSYLREDHNGLTDEMEQRISEQLPDYYIKHLNHDLLIYLAAEQDVLACVFLLITEKPANPSFPNGRIGTVLNVYTKPEYRRQGIAKNLLGIMLKEATEMCLDYIELEATEDGYPLYKAVGFKDKVLKYHSMKYFF